MLVPLDFAGQELIGHHILFKWPTYGCCLGRISDWNRNPKCTVCKQVVNFIVFYPDDCTSGPNHLSGPWTFLVKVKAHRGEPANEEVDIQADKAISSKDVPTEWHDRTNRAVFTWQEPRRKGGPVSYEDRKSTWNSEVRKAIRQGSAEEEVCKHWDRVTGAWQQTSNKDDESM